jgi:hypothetical protein
MSEQAQAIDKSAWGTGPWQDEPDRVEFVHAGLACLALRHPRGGNFCGYVAVPPGHPLHGRQWDNIPAAAGLDFHQGINYTAACEGIICHTPAPGEPDNVWWIGGDFGHIWDKCPGRDAIERELAAKWRAAGQTSVAEVFERVIEIPGMRPVYRALPYVRRQIEQLAEQLAAMRPARPVAIQRLMDEVRAEQTTPHGLFDRAHNRHNR